MALFSWKLKDNRSRWTAILVLLVLIALVLFLGGRYRSLRDFDPKGGNLFIFFLININILLLTVLVFLLARNAIKLFYEGKRRAFGYHLRTRLVLIFVGFSLIPTILLFFVAKGFINDSIEYWFNLNIEQAVEGSLSVTQDYYSTVTAYNRVFAQRVSEKVGSMEEGKALGDRLEELRKDYSLSMVELFDPDGHFLARAWDGTSPQNFVYGNSSLVQNALVGRVIDGVTSADKGEYIRASAPVRLNRGQGAVVVSTHLPQDIRQKSEAVARTYRGYTEMKLQKSPIRSNYLAYLLLITLLILFSAVWLGFYLARGITVPIGLLAEGAEKVAAGDLTVRIDSRASDEIGILVAAFNRMTEQLEATNRSLEKAYRENEQRRAYIETVLRNVGTGVVSLDLQKRINTFNRAAEVMFDISAEEILGRHYSRVLTPEHASLLESILQELREEGVTSIRKEVPVAVRGAPLILLVNASVMTDTSGNTVGTVFVIEDMTRLVNAQRKAAWSEAAKRIAHEIKNPLTPIKLSAERIRRKLEGRVGTSEGQVLREGTDSIIREVEAMRSLVDEFSQFARLPVLKPLPGDINRAVEDAVALFREAGERKGRIEVTLGESLPRMSFDGEQMRRVIINLLDNALRAVRDRGQEGMVRVSTSLLEAEGMVAVSVADNGSGIPGDLMDRIFEPYFSTQEGGTGLGLAIAQRITEEHGGTLRCSAGSDGGAVFTVRIPVDIDPVRRV
ncbi:MAG: HAMP domain-containing protein [bacterium]|nr:MAG: HAMP domain-containing protein [bacterium]